MSSLSQTGADSSSLLRRLIFLIVVVVMTFLHLVPLFRGLSEPTAMEQAQLGREIARGRPFETKFLRPVALYQAKAAGMTEMPLQAFQDTYHAPLYPFVLGAVIKAVGGEDFERYQMQADESLYELDRVVAATSTVLFLMSVGVTYLLVTRIFDGKIAGYTVILMIFCDLFWRFSLSGMPQMMLLLLLTCGLFFSYLAVEQSAEGRSSLGMVCVASFFFVLLALTHWLAIWLLVGFAIFAAFGFRPRAVGAVLVSVMLLLFVAFFLMRNMEWTNSPMGTAGLSVYGGLLGEEEAIMRTMDPSSQSSQVIYQLRSVVLNIVRSGLNQIASVYQNLGAIVAAPIFFLALLHPFKRPAIARFRWLLLLMWGFGVLGMGIFGMDGGVTSANQLHVLFAPLMTAYGLAFLAILWNRLNLVSMPFVHQHGHFVLVVLLSALPLCLALPKQVIAGLSTQQRMVQWPYYPVLMNRALHDITEENEIIASDQPWAVAWYADRLSFWLPREIAEFEAFESMAEDRDLTVAGVYVTPVSYEGNPLTSPVAFQSREEFAPLMLDTSTMSLLEPGSQGVRFQSPSLKAFNARYPYTQPFYLGRITYYSSQPLSR